jgi:glycosyltransferase involved in cell wall biosynthesis/SAM-dependent methyltransferase
MATYNRAMLISRAILSVIEQTFQDWEMVIVDDGSTDNTKEVVSTFSDERIRFFEKEHSGIPRTLNYAIERCRGKWLAVLGSDDRYDQKFLERNLELVNGNGLGTVSYCDFINFNPDGGFNSRYRGRKESRIGTLQKLLREPMTQVCSGYFVCARKLIEDVGGYSTAMRVSSDKHLLIKLLAKADHFEHIEEPLYQRILSPRDGISYNHLQTAQGRAEVSGRLMEAVMQHFSQTDFVAAEGEAIDRLGYERWRFETVLREFVAQNLWKYGLAGEALWTLLQTEARGLDPGKGMPERIWRALILRDAGSYTYGVVGNERESSWLRTHFQLDGWNHLDTVVESYPELRRMFDRAEVIFDFSHTYLSLGKNEEGMRCTLIKVPGRTEETIEKVKNKPPEFYRWENYQRFLRETFMTLVVERLPVTQGVKVLLQGSDALSVIARYGLAELGSMISYVWDNYPIATSGQPPYIGDQDLTKISAQIDLVIITSISSEDFLKQAVKNAGILCPVIGPSDLFQKELEFIQQGGDARLQGVTEPNEIRRLRPELEALYRACGNYISSDDLVLNVYSGYGFGSAILSETAGTVVAVEQDNKKIRFAKSHFLSPNLIFLDNESFQQRLESGTLPVPQAICLIDMLEHINTPLSVCRQWANLLPVKGRFVLSGIQPPSKDSHMGIVLDRHDLIALMEMLGLKVIASLTQINDFLVVHEVLPASGQRFLLIGERVAAH